eukprot:3126082-Amphidinium_carterae.1
MQTSPVGLETTDAQVGGATTYHRSSSKRIFFVSANSAFISTPCPVSNLFVILNGASHFVSYSERSSGCSPTLKVCQVA